MKNLLRIILRTLIYMPKRKRRILFSTIIIVAVIIAAIPMINGVIHPKKYVAAKGDTLNITVPYYEGNEAAEKVVSIPRGAEVEIRERGETTTLIEYEGETYRVDNSHLVDSLEECIKTDYVYPRRLLNLREDKNGKLSEVVVERGEKVKVIDVKVKDLDRKTGQIKWYRVEKGGEKYWLLGSHVEVTKEAATKNYAQDIVYSTYWDENYGKGYSKDAYVDQIDYKPQPAVYYEDNPIRTDTNVVHVSLSYLVNNKDYFLNLHNETGINAIAIELKGDGGTLFYQSDVPKNYLKKPEAAMTVAMMTKEELAALIKEFQQEGYYMIARVVTFKDSIYAKQNKDESIVDDSGNFLELNDEYWPSVYSRNAWMYNVDICKEICECGINEIQFDYCRFPDGTAKMDDIDMRNTYNESKASAIQGFFTYAKDELSQYHVYVAADVFAWPVVAQDDQDIGQFFPAIANVVDVVCPMPYTDLFSAGAMGIEDPTVEPRKTLFEFSSIARRQMKVIGTNAIYRTWIQAYVPFDAKDIMEEIGGINDAGFEGYLLWYGNGNPEDLKTVQDGFIDSKINKEEED